MKGGLDSGMHSSRWRIIDRSSGEKSRMEQEGEGGVGTGLSMESWREEWGGELKKSPTVAFLIFLFRSDTLLAGRKKSRLDRSCIKKLPRGEKNMKHPSVLLSLGCASSIRDLRVGIPTPVAAVVK